MLYPLSYGRIVASGIPRAQRRERLPVHPAQTEIRPRPTIASVEHREVDRAWSVGLTLTHRVEPSHGGAPELGLEIRALGAQPLDL